jgi:Dolichyl-phosphate-mannose-protein mannosyltransferase
MDALCCGSYLGLIALLGYAAMSAMLCGERFRWAELLGLSLACGFGLLGILLFYCSLAGFPPSRVILICIGVATAIALILVRQNLLRTSWSRGIGVRSPAKIFLAITSAVLIVAATANVASRSLTPGLQDIDAFAIWMFKAKIVTAEPLVPIPKSLLDNGLSYSHEDYPLGMPLVVGGMYAAIGRVDEQFGKTPMMLVYLSLMTVSYGALRRYVDRPIAAALTGIFIGMPVLVQHIGMAVAEVPLVLMHTCCLVLLLRWMQNGGRRNLVASAVFAAFAAFTKNEGLALLPVVAAAALAFALFRRKRELFGDWLLAVAVTAVLISPWIVYRAYLPRNHEDYGSKLTSAATIIQNLPRLRQLIPMYFGLLWELRTAGGIWFVLLIVAILGWRAFSHPTVLVLWGIVLAHLMLYLVTFEVTPWDLKTLLWMVGPKLLMHIAPAAMLLIALHLSAVETSTTDDSEHPLVPA